MNPPAVLFERRGPVALATLNRPHVLNAYDRAMRDALFEILEAVRDDPEVRVLILGGNGSSFCSGGDLTEFGSAPSPLTARETRWRRDVWGALTALSQVTIAAVHGYVVGGGFEMALLCDLCVAAEDSRFSYPETARGMIPGVGGTQTTSRSVGLGRSLDMVLTGRTIDAIEARRLGFVCRVAGCHDLRDVALDLAGTIAALPPRLVRRLKRAVSEGLELPLPAALELEHRLSLQDSNP